MSQASDSRGLIFGNIILVANLVLAPIVRAVFNLGRLFIPLRLFLIIFFLMRLPLGVILKFLSKRTKSES